jgi:hypothetical protein
MKRNKKLILAVCCTMLLFAQSCEQMGKLMRGSSTPEELFAKYRKSVVMIKNEYFYVIKLTNSKSTELYFTELDNGNIKNVEFDASKVSPKTTYGTGFFVSADGKIATNRHVADPPIDDAKELLRRLKATFDKSKLTYQDEIADYTKKMTDIKTYIRAKQSEDELSQEDFNKLQLAYTDYESKREKANSTLSLLDFDPNTSTIEAKVVTMGVAYDNTFVTKSSDYKECVRLKVATDGADLALLQLKDKTIPANTEVFTIPEKKSEEKDNEAHKLLKINTKLYMIGYNYANAVGATDEGLKAQLTQGTVSQEPTKFQFLHTIPTLSGSSGSPIIDEEGNLVGVNFAGMRNTQSFNYAVPIKNLKKLLDE